ncbi:MAG: hypothetical protein EOP11_16400, partial [Proteobacteria bacterium]
MTKASFRRLAEEKLIARALSELSFEGIFAPEPNGADSFAVNFGSAHARYDFKAHRGAWGHLTVLPGSIRRFVKDQPAPLGAAHFFLDCREAHGMGDITLAHFFEEMQNTLFGDEILLEAQGQSSAGTLAEAGDLEIQALLDGHPKILLNKGRLGFTAEDFQRYAPEARPRFRLEWLAVKKE